MLFPWSPWEIFIFVGPAGDLAARLPRYEDKFGLVERCSAMTLASHWNCFELLGLTLLWRRRWGGGRRLCTVQTISKAPFLRWWYRGHEECLCLKTMFYHHTMWWFLWIWVINDGCLTTFRVLAVVKSLVWLRWWLYKWYLYKKINGETIWFMMHCIWYFLYAQKLDEHPRHPKWLKQLWFSGSEMSWPKVWSPSLVFSTACFVF